MSKPRMPGTGDAAGESRDPRACLYVPYPHGNFPSPKSAEQAARAFVSETDAQTVAELWVSTGLLRVFVPLGTKGRTGGGPRGQIELWSKKSRSSMVRHLATLDYSPWAKLSSEGWTVVMLTLTYPGSWEELVPGSSIAVAHLRAFRARLTRALGQPPLAIWKREFQRRGAPHYHLLIALPLTIGVVSIYEWASNAWYETVRSNDPRHLVAGTGIDFATGRQAVDPVRVAKYFSGHAAPSGRSRKEYQNLAPTLWLENGDVGRFWGVWGLHPVKETAPLSLHQLIEVRRILRGIDRSHRRTRVVRVARVKRESGVIYFRRVRRRAVLGHLASGRLVGASIFTSDGPAVANLLARYVRTKTTPDQRDPEWIASRKRIG
jgi:hypothetical protein